MKMTLVDMFDDLVRNSKVLQDSCEEQFIRYLQSSELNRKRWENAEVECQRLNIEMNKAFQDKQSLELKLENARSLLDSEVKVRKRAEAERDKLRGQLSLLKELIMDDQFTDDVKMNKIRSLGRVGDEYDPEDVFQPHHRMVTTPKGILKRPATMNADETEEMSVNDIDDFSFDDTQDLCNSRRRSSKRSRSRSRSAGRQANGGACGGLARQDTVALLESVASPRTPDTLHNLRQQHKRHRRSRSAVNFQAATPTSLTTDTTSTTTATASEEQDTRPRAYSASVHNNEKTLDQCFQESPNYLNLLPESGHTFTHKTVIKSEKCSVCGKRMGFGRAVLKCTACRSTLHKECVDMAPTICTPLHEGSPDVCRTPGGVKRSASVKKPYFASPMLR